MYAPIARLVLAPAAAPTHVLCRAHTCVLRRTHDVIRSAHVPCGPRARLGRSPPRSGTEFNVLPGLDGPGSSATILYAPDPRSRLPSAELGATSKPLHFVGTTPRPP